MRFLLLLLGLSLSTILTAQTPENLGQAVNSEYNEISPVISPDGKTLYFVREKHPNNPKGGDDIWFCELVSGFWSSARRMSSVVNRDEYNTLYSISPDGNTLLLKGAYESGQYETRGFSISKKKPEGWSVPQKLLIPNYEKMSRGLFDYGFMSNDGKVLLMSFSEKKNSGIDDLYVSLLGKDGKWSEPISLGAEINTGDFTETTPFLASDGVTLYFSSNRKGGLGSNDIYVAKRLDKSWKRWSKPINVGAPINTEDYDGFYSISAAGDYAYLSTRKGQFGKGDIVRIALQTKPTEPTETSPIAQTDPNKAGSTTPNNSSNGGVTPQTLPSTNPVPPSSGIGQTVPTTPAIQPTTTSKLSEPVVLLSGKLYDAKTKSVPKDAKIIYEDLATGNEEGVATPDPTTGEYKITLPYGKKYGITAIVGGFVAKSQNIDLTNPGKYLELGGRDIAMVPIEKGATIQMNNIFFEYAKATLQATSFSELNRVVQLLNRNTAMKIEISGHTDNVGLDENNLKLSQERAEAVKTYLLSKGVNAVRLSAKGYGETKPIATNDTEEGKQQNRRVEFVIIEK
jgi:outer membrane protein OmpA-like peptidoglycan-associated protein